MTSLPLTDAEQAAAEALAYEANRAMAAQGESEDFAIADLADDARIALNAARPHLLAEFYEAMAESTEKNGALTPEGLRACALLARQSLSRPTSGEN